jgi:hypothetical protein
MSKKCLRLSTIININTYILCMANLHHILGEFGNTVPNREFLGQITVPFHAF